MNSDKYDSDVWPNDYVYGLQKKTRELTKHIAQLEARIAELEKVVEAVEICRESFWTPSDKWEHVDSALRAAGYLQEKGNE